MQNVSCKQVRAGLQQHHFTNCDEIKDFIRTAYYGSAGSFACEEFIGAATNYKAHTSCRKYRRPETNTQHVLIKCHQHVISQHCLSI